MIKRTLRGAIAIIAVAVGLGLAAPAAAPVSNPAAPGANTLTPKRIMASGAIVTALIGAVIGALALTRTAGRTGNRRRRAIVALTLGPIALVMGGLVVATADGGIGTGNGLAGAIVAIVVGLVGTILGGLALARGRPRGQLEAD
jgi:hypothetical protein